MHHRIADEIVEVLEAVWTSEEEGNASEEGVANRAMTEVTPELLAECEQAGYIERPGGGEVRLTARGRQKAEEV
ncbi:MAG: hypothetical protein ACKOB4_15870, partial [Acidobacteriota bacterium]